VDNRRLMPATGFQRLDRLQILAILHRLSGPEPAARASCDAFCDIEEDNYP
jgi:hypothetical protein